MDLTIQELEYLKTLLDDTIPEDGAEQALHDSLSAKVQVEIDDQGTQPA